MCVCVCTHATPRHPLVANNKTNKLCNLGIGSCAVPSGGTGGGSQRRHHQAHPAADVDVHRDAVSGEGAHLRGDGNAR